MESASDRLRIALDMSEFGERMRLARMRRDNPQATDAELARELQCWRLSRPGAPDGDSAGMPSTRFA
jgi:hypothetical protein